MAVDNPTPPPRAWQRMLSGRRLDLLAPSPSDIAIEDIAHGLARVARWNGQTVGQHAFSVAQHSLVVSDIFESLNPAASAVERRAALLHDAAEYVIGDLISPFKAAIGFDYRSFEARLVAAIHETFSIGALAIATTVAIKEADRIAAYYEATRLAGFSEEEARLYFDHAPVPAALNQSLAALISYPADEAQKRFLARFAELAV